VTTWLTNVWWRNIQLVFYGRIGFCSSHVIFMLIESQNNSTDCEHVTLWSIVVWVTHHGIWCFWNMQNDHQMKYVCHLDNLALIQRLMSKLVSNPESPIYWMVYKWKHIHGNFFMTQNVVSAQVSVHPLLSTTLATQRCECAFTINK